MFLKPQIKNAPAVANDLNRLPPQAAVGFGRYHGRGSSQEIAMPQLDRITQQPEVMGGKACIRGMRVTVGMLVGQIAAGRTIEDLLVDYPYLEREDILQALQYAAWRLEEREIRLTST